MVACFLDGRGSSQHCTIGVNAKSVLFKTLSQQESGHIAFLPIFCHELAHIGQTMSIYDEAGTSLNSPHDQNFYIDTVRMTDSVLIACASYLNGETPEIEAPGAEGEVIFL